MKTLLCVALCFIAHCSLGSTAARAGELPADTNKIESLTLEWGRKLAKDFPGVVVEVETKGLGKREIPGCLPLNGLKSLDAETAKVLAGYGKGRLLLNGLTTLDAATAKALAEFKGVSLAVNGLTALDDDAANALAEVKVQWLDLAGLTTLDAETAAALAAFKGVMLSLNGLTTLDAEAAKALAAFKGDTLFLNGLTSLNAETAKVLAVFKGGGLSLQGPHTLDAETAKALAEFKGEWLEVNGLTTLSDDTAKALGEFKGNTLALNGLISLNANTAKALAELKGRLYLTKAVTESFCMKNPFTSETASTWAALLQGDMSFVTALDSPDSVAIAKALAARKGPLSLPNLKKISPKTLSALIEKEDVEIPLIETLELIQEPDGSVTEDFIVPQWLSMRESRVKKEKRPN
jgi:ubiquinone biosynthesis protein UbiJ